MNEGSEAPKFGPEAMERYEWLLTRYPTKQAALLPTIRLAEEQFGNLGPAQLKYVADLMGFPPARVLGVFSFYTHFRREGTGCYHIQVCHTLSCALRGAKDLVQHLEKKLDVRVGETTEDGLFTLSKVECLASCDTAPMLQCNDDYHENLDLDAADTLIDSLRREAATSSGGKA